ncbi:MAG TPA: hypothetical protein VLF41_03390 [Candidatus Nanoarchaeia archaeon]|nr:hypothetical protein [Candidatus Nanoarchaeia archaeon]
MVKRIIFWIIGLLLIAQGVNDFYKTPSLDPQDRLVFGAVLNPTAWMILSGAVLVIGIGLIVLAVWLSNKEKKNG